MPLLTIFISVLLAGLAELFSAEAIASSGIDADSRYRRVYSPPPASNRNNRSSRGMTNSGHPPLRVYPLYRPWYTRPYSPYYYHRTWYASPPGYYVPRPYVGPPYVPYPGDPRFYTPPVDPFIVPRSQDSDLYYF